MRKTESNYKSGIGGQVDYLRQGRIRKTDMSSGNIKGRTEIILSDGKTVVYCKPDKDPAVVREYWENKLKEYR